MGRSGGTAIHGTDLSTGGGDRLPCSNLRLRRPGTISRSAGHIPGVAPTDYAFYNFCGTSSQLYQFSPPEVEGSTIEALGDLGFQTWNVQHICPRVKHLLSPALQREVGR